MGKTFAVPDIHGRYDLLCWAIAQIEQAADGGVVVFTGDYVDRGFQSRQVIERLIAGPTSDAWKWICLKGNHEDMMVQCVRGKEDIMWWLDNGGVQTVASYPHRTVSEEHLIWAESLKQMYVDKHRVFVHAGVDPTIPLLQQPEGVSLWIRLGELEDIDFGQWHVVHGHTPFPHGPILLTGRTNLDTLAYRTGRLVVGVFNDEVPGGPSDLIEIFGE